MRQEVACGWSPKQANRSSTAVLASRAMQLDWCGAPKPELQHVLHFDWPIAPLDFQLSLAGPNYPRLTHDFMGSRLEGLQFLCHLHPLGYQASASSGALHMARSHVQHGKRRNQEKQGSNLMLYVEKNAYIYIYIYIFIRYMCVCVCIHIYTYT